MERPKTPEEWTVHVLNIHGSVFEKWTETLLRSLPEPWTVHATQFPVEFPPPAGPTRGHESVLDVWVDYRPGVTWVSLLVECKKNDPDFVDWVFFPANESDPAAQHVGVVSLQIKEGRDGALLGPELMKRSPPPAVVVADEGRETRGRWDGKDERQQTRTTKKAIAEASHQVSLATQAIINEQWLLVRDAISRKELHNLESWRWRSFLPVILTTANLKVAYFDPQRVDPGRGEIAWSEVTLKEVDWLWYLYALPRHLQFGSFESLTLHRDGAVHFLSKFPIAVVRSTHIRDFADLVASRPFFGLLTPG